MICMMELRGFSFFPFAAVAVLPFLRVSKALIVRALVVSSPVVFTIAPVSAVLAVSVVGAVVAESFTSEPFRWAANAFSAAVYEV
jgi:hypothetical protein